MMRYLKINALLALFFASYSPLFLIILIKHIYDNWNIISSFFSLGYFDTYLFIKYFVVPIGFLLILSYGSIGLYLLLKNLNERIKFNGSFVSIKSIENKNSESIAYLFTYIVPFAFQDLTNLSDVLALTILLTVAGLLYSKSSMIVINPVLNIFYNLYNVSYCVGQNDDKKGIIICKNGNLEVGNNIKIYTISQNIFYSEYEEEK